MNTPPAGPAAPAAPVAPGASGASGASGAKIVSCPACGASITLRALGQSVMLACPSCGSQMDVSRPDVALIRRYNEQTRQLHIPLGSRGKLHGQTFEVIGAMRRSSGGFSWEEYLLFNPFVGFRWLVYDHGHWSFGQMIKDTSNLHPDLGRPYQGHVFRKYAMDSVVVDWVVGEFYWRVTTGETVLATDYVAPPWMLSCEKAAGEVTWTLLQYLEPAEVETAFHIQSPDRIALGANQPNAASEALHLIRRIAALAIGVAFLIQLLYAALAHNTYTSAGSYNLVHSASDETQVYGPFTLTARHSVVEVSASAPLDNAWVELQGSLVNTDSGQQYHFANAFQYYHGYDSDGSWSDGAGNGRALIGGVPAGTYKLLVDGSSGNQYGRAVEASVQLGLTQDLVTWRNFWICTLIILLYPIYLTVRSIGYERERWADSAYSRRVA